jgi:hypothetical protein
MAVEWEVEGGEGYVDGAAEEIEERREGAGRIHDGIRESPEGPADVEGRCETVAIGEEVSGGTEHARPPAYEYEIAEVGRR